jgi:hypothetical protein
MVAQTSLSERLGLRLQVLRELAASLREAQAAVLALNLDRLQLHTARQQALVEAMRTLVNDVTQDAGDAGGNIEIKNTRGSAPGTSTHLSNAQPLDPVWHQVLQEQARVRHLNRVLGALLRRGRRSMEILALLHASCAITYAQPKLLRPPAASRREE